MEQFVNLALVTFFIVREVVFRVVPPTVATGVIVAVIPASVREKKIRGIDVGPTYGGVPAIAIIVFVMLAVVWHFTIAAHPEWRVGWYRE